MQAALGLKPKASPRAHPPQELTSSWVSPLSSVLRMGRAAGADPITVPSPRPRLFFPHSKGRDRHR